ncbi:MAG: Wzz/FepE/Etk N-terminal domain-containing protein [Bacillota bacterium]|nr:Wzz/FepE/Etk N-terminal domain-containing protein [Bacillota bacterium]
MPTEPEGQMSESELVEEEIDLRQYLRVLSKWRWLIAGVTLLAMLTAAAISWFALPPVYATETTLMVRQVASPQQQQQPTPNGQNTLQQLANPLNQLPAMTLDSYVAEVTAPSLLQQVIKDLKLDPKVYTVASLAQAIQAEAVQNTNLIKITVQNTDPALAQRIADTLARDFLGFVADRNEQTLSQSTAYLRKQLDAVAKQLTQARSRLEQLQAQPRAASVIQQELQSTQQLLAKYQQDAVDAQVQLDAARSAESRAEALLAQTPPTVTTESTTVAVLPGQQNGQPTPLKTTTDQPNPVYQQLQQEVTQQTATVASQQARLDQIHQTIAELTDRLGQLQKELTVQQGKEDVAKAEVDQLSQTYGVLEQNITATQIVEAANLASTDISVVSPAPLPNVPVRPNKKLNVAVAGVLGLMVSVVLAFVLEFLDNTIKTAADVERWSGLPTLASIPHFEGGE